MFTGQLTDAQKFTIDVLWVAISQIVLAIVNIACLPVITKSYPVEQYGIWTQVNATVGILAGILSLYLGTALILYVSGVDNKEERRKAYNEVRPHSSLNHRTPMEYAYTTAGF